MKSLGQWSERESRKRRMLFSCSDEVEEKKRHKRSSETEEEDEEKEEEEEGEEEEEKHKISGRLLFANVREFLSTGLLEGVPVTYNNSFHNVELEGFIKGDKYLCGCSLCNYKVALSANKFEKHARATSSHANNHIFLRNGKPLHEVVKQLNSARDSSLYEEMQNATGCTINIDNFESWRRSETIKFRNSSALNDQLPREKCVTRYKESLSSMRERISTQSVISHLNIHALHDTEEGKPFNSEDDIANHFQVQERETLVDASRTKRFIDLKSKGREKSIKINMKGSNISSVRTLLSTGLLEGFPVTYKKGKIEIPGIIRDLGYLCGCSSCDYTKVLSALEFEKHARMASKNQNDHIFLDSGISLYKLVKILQAKCIEPTAENIAYFTGSRPKIKCLENGKGISTNAKKIQDDILDLVVHQSETDAEGSPETFDTFNFLQQGNGGRTCQNITADSKFSYSGTDVRSCAEIATTDSNGWLVQEVETISFTTSSLKRNLSTIQLSKEGDMQPSSLDSGKGSHERIVAQQSNFSKQGDGIEVQQSSGLILTPRSPGVQYSTSCAHISAVEANSLPSAKDICQKISSLTEDMCAINLSQKSGMSCMLLSSKREGSASKVCNSIPSESSSDPLREYGHLAASKDQSFILSSNTVNNSSFMMQPGVNKDPDPDPDPNPNFNGNLISQISFLKQRTYPAIMNHDSNCKQLSNVSTSSSHAEMKKYSNKIPTVAALQGSAFFPKLNDSHGQSKVTTDIHSRSRAHNLHQFIFKDNGLPDGSQLSYCIKGEVVKTGRKIGYSITCDCCKKQMSPSQFEAHAGHSMKRQPYHNIYTSDGKSLHAVLISLSRCENSLLSSTEVHFDGCSELPYIPGNKLSFTNREDHFCSRDGTRIKRGGISGSSKLLVKRQLQVQIIEHLCCTLCHDTEYSLDIFNEKTEIFCVQCEREYHIGCLKTHKICDLKEFSADRIWFCSRECNAIFDALHKLVISGEQFGKKPGDSSLLRVVMEKALERSSTKILEADMQWQILSGKYSEKQLLSQANAIFHDAFAPIVGRGCNLIPSMICGEDAGGRLFEGIHCAVITVKSSIVSAGIFRIFGRRAAELPLITTLQKYQRKGYFKLLLMMIEELLLHLNVESLLVPADEGEQSLWIEKHGFAKLTDEKLLAYLKDYPLLTFQNTTMLEKAIHHPFPG